MSATQKKLLGIIIAGIVILGILIGYFVLNSGMNNSIGNSNSANPTPEVRYGLQTYTVKLTPDGFVPQTINVKKGGIIVWKNESGAQASVNSADHPTHKLHRFLNLGMFENGSGVQATIPETGTFSYHNHLKPEQTGTIIATE